MAKTTDPNSFAAFHRALASFLPPARLLTDPLRTLAFGTDASFYRLIPKMVIKTETAAEISRILNLCREQAVSVTFRAAGTSLSGQAVTDSVLLIAGENWKKIRVHGQGETVTLEPGVTGGEANRALAPFGRKIGPDPASLESAMIGGIAANNASGICCGIRENSYQTVRGMKVILADGVLLDTADPQSRETFFQSHAALIQELRHLSASVKTDPELSALIRRKYRIKNTTGYSLNALVDFEDPLDILEHLMIGSEGTLGFIAEITYQTVAEPPCRAAALVEFAGLDAACRAAALLAQRPAVRAAELMDRASLQAVWPQCRVLGLQELGPQSCALLIELQGSTADEITLESAAVGEALRPLCLSEEIRFFQDAASIQQLWQVRKGLFPSVGALRRAGTSVVIEDICFPQESLAQGTRDLRELLNRHGYADAIIFGHALAGNLHFVFKQDWAGAGEVERYGRFMEAMAELVSGKYQGSLKAEHGTGRNMAPFVEKEWGQAAYALMKKIKILFDPAGILNPGVILNPDPAVHLKNFKPMPAADAAIDACTECGFCEPVCPSKDLTMTPRQRITVYREIRRLERSREDDRRLRVFKNGFAYQGEATCAADGLCATRCPVGIDTGHFIKKIRAKRAGRVQQFAGLFFAKHFCGVLNTLSFFLSIARAGSKILGPGRLETLTGALNRISKGRIPRWYAEMPVPGRFQPAAAAKAGEPVVYFPSCLARTFSGKKKCGRKPLVEAAGSLLEKSGHGVIYPQGLEGLCCGLIFESKGFETAAAWKLQELQAALEKISDRGKIPIFTDTSPCSQRLKQALQGTGLQLHDPAEWIAGHAALFANVQQQDSLALHIPCSARKQGLESVYRKAAGLLAARVVESGTACCGFAGDKGFFVPELSISALAGMNSEALGMEGCSASLLCETALARRSGANYESLIHRAEAALPDVRR